MNIILDNDQNKIVKSSNKNILVIASAGSGKTRVLTERIKYLICEKDVDPHNIIAITFTNQAASEMKSRLSEIPNIDKAFIGTIHSLAYRVLKKTNSSFKILTDELDNQLHLELIKKYCKELTAYKYSKYKELEMKYKLKIINKDEFVNFLTYREVDELSKIEGTHRISNYPETIITLCKTRNIITFNQLLKLVTYYFKEVNIKSEYVFVDELQDIGSLEYKFIMSLNADNYFFVGDDWQSIYSFKGGNIEIFKSLYHDNTFKNYYLETNYRSGFEVILFSKKVINKVTDKFKKSVKNYRSDTGFVVTTNTNHLNTCINYIKNSDNYSDWFILTRTNSDIYQLSLLLSENGIPFQVFKRDGMTNTQIEEFLSNNSVKLMTVHASKGLENKNVLLYGNFSLNSKFTCSKSDPDYGYKLFKYEEELKVFYVGVTRAKDNLIIVDTTPWNQHNSSNNLQLLINRKY